MKNLKLIFGLLMVSAFVAVTVISATSDEQAINKKGIILPSKG